jgi:hypothetical protein
VFFSEAGASSLDLRERKAKGNGKQQRKRPGKRRGWFVQGGSAMASEGPLLQSFNFHPIRERIPSGSVNRVKAIGVQLPAFG